jgi:MFS family permease
VSSSHAGLLTGYSGRLFVSLSLGWLGLQFGRQLLPPLLPAIIDGLSISPFQAGLALTVTWGASALVQYLGSRLADGLSSKTVLVASLVLMLSGFATLSNTRSYAALPTGGALLGTGMGPYLITARTLTSDLFEQARGKALGAQQAIGICGSVLAGGVAAVAFEAASWRVAFLPVVGVFAVVVVLLHRWSAEPYVVARVRLSPRPSMRGVFGTPTVRHVVVVYALFAFA